MDVRSRLQTALREAMKARDSAAASALRSALGAIGNAEAIPPSAIGNAEAIPPSAIGNAEAIPVPGAVRPGDHQHIAGSAGSLGAGEAERRILTEEDVAGIVQAEVTQRLVAASQYEAAGYGDRASRLRREAEVIASAARSADAPLPSPGFAPLPAADLGCWAYASATTS
jgi:uncharacterized protein